MLKVWSSPEFLMLALGVTAGALLIARRLRRSGQSRHVQVLNAVLALILLVVGGPALRQAEQEEHGHLAAMLAGIAPTYARELETLGHAALASGARPDDPLYLTLIAAQRRWLAANPSVADIYTFRRRADGSVFLLVDSETDYDRDGRILGEREERTPIGETYEEPYASLLAAFEGEPSFTTEVVTDRWGSWVCAHEPLRAPDGTVEAVLGVDYPAEAWLVVGAGARRARLGWLGALALLSQLSLFVTAVLLPHLRERRRVERELSGALERAEESSRAKSQFLSTMSHELRTPLNGMLALGELLRDTGLDEEQREMLAALESSGQSLKRLIDDLLDLSWLDGGVLQLSVKPFDPAGALREVCAAPERSARARGVSFRLVLDPALPARVEGDGLRFAQIAGHLLANAVKFTLTGEIVLALHVDGRTGTRVRLVLEVRDTGVGFDERQMGQLFQPFTQADGSPSRRQGGAGIGLAFVHGVVRAMQGEVEATSRVGAGSTFLVRLSLPVVEEARRPEEPRAPHPRPAEPEPGQRCALIVDDHEPNRRLLQRLLEPKGWHCVAASDGASALEHLRARRFEVVLLDMSMPGMDGSEVVRRLQALEGGQRSTPVLAVTALEVGALRRKLAELGIEGWIEKPVDPALLFAELARVSAAQAPGVG